VEINYDLTYR